MWISIPLVPLYPLLYSAIRMLQSGQALCPDSGLFSRIPLGQPPSLHHLRQWQRTIIIARGFPYIHPVKWILAVNAFTLLITGFLVPETNASSVFTS